MALSPSLMAAIKGAKAKHSRGGLTKIVKVKEGKTKVRILPGLGEDGIFWQDLGIHWIKQEKNGKPVAVVGCHDHTYEQPCPVCTAIDKALKSATDDTEVELYKEWGARKEVLVNALIRSGSDASEDPVVLSLTSTTFAAILSVIEEYADEMGNILDPDTGIDFVIERAGKGLDTKYTVMPAPKSTAVPKAALDKRIDLAEFVQTEFFGKDTKALNAIASISGVTPAISHATKAMLTGPSAKIVDVEPTEDEPPFETAPVVSKKSTPAPAPVAEVSDDGLSDDLEDILKDLDKI